MKFYHVYSPISYFFIIPYPCLASSCIRPEILWSWKKINKSYYQSPKLPLEKEKRRIEEKKIRTKWTNSCYWKFKYLEFHNIITTGNFSIVRRLVRLFKQYATIKWCRHMHVSPLSRFLHLFRWCWREKDWKWRSDI